MKRLICFAVFFFAACAFGEERSVDGSYPVQLTPNAENKTAGTGVGYPDTVTIKDGQLMTEVSKKQNFKPGEIAVTVDGDKIKITTTLVGRGKSRYDLELKDGKISGKMIWDCDPGSEGRIKHAEYSIAPKEK